MSKFIHDADDDIKAIAIPWVFSKTAELKMEKMLLTGLVPQRRQKHCHCVVTGLSILYHV